MDRTTPPTISIITVVFNALPLLKVTAASVQALRDVRVEHWVIDGGSTDGTVEWLREQGCASTMRWVSEPDEGIYDAMNKGLARATGDYVWFLNAGDLPFDEGLFSSLAGQRLPDVLYGDTALVDDAGAIRKIARAPARLTVPLMLGGMHVSHQSFLVRRRVAPPYDRRYRHIADNKWVVDCLARADGSRHIGTVSRYLMGGISERHYWTFWREKVRFTADELGLWRSLPYLASDVGKALRFVASKWSQHWGGQR